MPPTTRSATSYKPRLAALVALMIILAHALPAYSVTETIDYSYDNTYQLKQADYNNGAKTFNYTYNDSGNMTVLDITPRNRIEPGSTLTTLPETLSGEHYILTGTAWAGSLAGIRKVEVSTDGGATWDTAIGGENWRYTWTLPANGPGNSRVTRSIKTKATDHDGNVQETFGGSVVGVENTSPTTAITAPIHGSTLTDVHLTVSGTCTPGTAGVMEVSVSVDDRMTWTPAANTSGDWSTWRGEVILPCAGQQKVIIRARDVAGNEFQTASVTVNVNGGVPSSLAPDRMSPVEMNTGQVRWTASATGGSGDYVYKFELGTADTNSTECAWADVQDSANNSFNWLPPATAGRYKIRVSVRDNCGQTYSSVLESDFFVISDSIPPDSVIKKPIDEESLDARSVTISGTASDNDSLSEVQLSISRDGAGAWFKAQNLTGAASDWGYVWNVPADGTGSYIVKSRAVDKSGNTEAEPAVVHVGVNFMTGTVSLDQDTYSGPMDRAEITVYDMDANVSPGNERLNVTVTSGSDSIGETVTLTEDTDNPGIFKGSVGFSPFMNISADGKLFVSRGDTVTVKYDDPYTPAGITQQAADTAMWSSGRAIRVTNVDALVNNLAARAEFFAFCDAPHGCAADRIDTILFDGLTTINTSPTALRNFITEAHANKMMVCCLMGEPDWATDHAVATQAINTVTSFNGSGGRFDGIHLSVEPEKLTDWETDKAAIWSNYIAMLASCRSQIDSYNAVNPGNALTLGSEMAAWYDTGNNGVTNNAIVQGATDYTVVNARKDKASDISSAIQGELDYATQNNKKLLCGVETADMEGALSGETFHEEGWQTMNNRLANVTTTTGSFIGFVPGSYDSYKNMPAKDTLVAITSPLPNFTTTASSCSVTGTARSVNGVKKVQVSKDNGSTWADAVDTGNGTWETWTYNWVLPATGPARIMAKTIDMDNVESAPITVNHGLMVNTFNCDAPDAVLGLTYRTYNLTAGHALNWTTTARGGSGAYLFEYSQYGPATGNYWLTKRSYDTSGVWAWNTSNADTGIDRVRVRIKDGSGSETSYRMSTYIVQLLPQPQVSLRSDKTIENVGGSITFTGEASGGSGSYEYQFLHNLAGGWEVVKAYSGSNEWVWSNVSGTVINNEVKVQARNTGTEGSFDAEASKTVQIYGVPSVTLASSSPNNTQGGKITWTAIGAGGSGNYEYEFWLNGPATQNLWVMKQNYSSSPTWEWTTGSDDKGTNYVRVNVRNAGTTGSTACNAVDPTSVVWGLASMNGVTCSPASYSQPVGTQITWTATGKDGSGNYEYEFWLYGPGTGNLWEVRQAYSGQNKWVWTPSTTDAGINRVRVYIKNAGESRSDVYNGYMLSNQATTIYSDQTAQLVSLSSNQPSTVTVGTTSTWTAVGTGGSGSYEYEFWLYGPASNNTWVRKQAYSSSNTWSWTTVAGYAGQNRVKVNIRNAGSTITDGYLLSPSVITVTSN